MAIFQWYFNEVIIKVWEELHQVSISIQLPICKLPTTTQQKCTPEAEGERDSSVNMSGVCVHGGNGPYLTCYKSQATMK